MRKINAPRTTLRVGVLSIIIAVVLFAAFGSSAARLFGLASSQPAGAASSTSSDLYHLKSPSKSLMTMMRTLRAVDPTIQTDKPDYAPGETVIITGSGWLAGEAVSLHMEESDADAPWDSVAIADANGISRTRVSSFKPMTWVCSSR